MAVHVATTVRKQREMSAGAHQAFSFPMFYSLNPIAHGTAPPTFMIDLFSSVKPLQMSVLTGVYCVIQSPGRSNINLNINLLFVNLIPKHNLL